MTVRLHRILCWAYGSSTRALRRITRRINARKTLPKGLALGDDVGSDKPKWGKFIGSAVLALADDVVLTAWHVVADARSVCAVFADGQRANVIGYIDYDGGRDLALLKLEERLPTDGRP